MSNPIRKAVMVSIAGNYGSLLISFALMVLVSRWLDPAEIGAFVVAFALVVTIDAIRELNVSLYVVQASLADKPLYQSAFGLSIVSSVISSVVLYVAAGRISEGFTSPDMERLLQIMALGFLVSPLTLPVTAFLSREMRFGELMIIKLVGAIARALVTLGILSCGFGNIALAWGFVASRLGEVVAASWTTAPYKIVVPTLKCLKPILRFGVKTTVSQILGTLGMTIADLATGRSLGMASAALYNRGASLVAIYRNGIEGAVLPVAYAKFAQISRDSGDQLAVSYLHSLRLLTSFGWPALAMLGVLAAPLIQILFGPEWLPGSIVAQIIAFGAAIYMLGMPAPRLLTAIGQVDALLKRELAIQVPRILMVAIGAQFNIEGVAWAVAATYVLAFIVNHFIVRSVIGVTFQHIWAASKGSIVAAIATGAVGFLASTGVRLQNLGPGAEVAAASFAAIGTWLIVVLVAQQPAGEEVRIAWDAALRRCHTGRR